MSSADAAWLHMDRPTNLMVITGALWFDEPLDWDDVREVIADAPGRPLPALPPAGQREPRPAARCRSWEDDPDFDLDLHLHHTALPAPGDRAALQDLVADLMAQPLDRSRPLWHWYLVDGYGSGSAIVARMHHCIADGIALARVLLSLTDPARCGHRARGSRGRPSTAGSGLLGDLVRPARRVASIGRDVRGRPRP